MGEHTVPVGTHGTALYRELQNVPMIFYIPDNAPHAIGGATTNLDIVPTIAELAGIDVHDLSFEGKSEVPAIFYGKEDHSRIVFAETNAPTPQRAAISEAYKLIYYLQSNIYELYDLAADPWEHNNLAPKHPPAFDQMKAALDAWLERVVYARDADFNQANERIKDVLLGTTAPHPRSRPPARPWTAASSRSPASAPTASSRPAPRSTSTSTSGSTSARPSSTGSCSRCGPSTRRPGSRPTRPPRPCCARSCARPPTGSSRATAGASTSYIRERF